MATEQIEANESYRNKLKNATKQLPYYAKQRFDTAQPNMLNMPMGQPLFIRPALAKGIMNTTVLYLQLSAIGAIAYAPGSNRKLYIYHPRDKEGSHSIEFTSDEYTRMFLDKLHQTMEDNNMLVKI